MGHAYTHTSNPLIMRHALSSIIQTLINPDCQLHRDWGILAQEKGPIFEMQSSSPCLGLFNSQVLPCLFVMNMGITKFWLRRSRMKAPEYFNALLFQSQF